jgi:hypothetical protein
VPTGFHPDAHLLSLDRRIAIKRFRFLAMFQSSFSAIASFTTHKRNLLKGWLVIASYCKEYGAVNLPHDVGDSRPAGRSCFPAHRLQQIQLLMQPFGPQTNPRVLESWPTMRRDAGHSINGATTKACTLC